MNIYLYLKTHNVTGLKYLGQTTNNNPHKYTGSGKYWKLHLAKHGKDYSTTILHECTDPSEIISLGKYYSELWNVVDSTEFANLIIEDGNSTSHTKESRDKMSQSRIGVEPWNKGKSMWTDEEKLRISDHWKNYVHSDEMITRRTQTRLDNGYSHSEETKQKISNSTKGRKPTAATLEKMSIAAKKNGYNGHGFKPGHATHNAMQCAIKNTITGVITEHTSLKQWATSCDGVNYSAASYAFKIKDTYRHYEILR